MHTKLCCIAISQLNGIEMCILLIVFCLFSAVISTQ